MGACTSAPTAPPTSFRSIMDDKTILASPHSCFKEHLARVNDMSAFRKKYTVGKLLGEGITGQVRLVQSISDGQVFAMKSLNLDKMDENQIYELRREIETLRSLDHPNIISLMEVYQNSDNLYIIMEHCSGTDLGHRKLKTEQEVCSIVYQLTEAVAHCHYMNVVHRDLKLENIMFASESSDSIRLIDFGLSKRFLTRADILAGEQRLMNRRVMRTACGTAFYMAPEMLQSSYSEKADIWAIGVITYMILTGRPPFEGRSEDQVFAKLKRGAVVNYSQPIWKQLPACVLDFCKRMLQFDPRKRPSAKEALELDWLATFARKRTTDMQHSVRGQVLAQSVCNSVIHYATYPRLKRLALMAVAHHLQEEDTRELRDFFLVLDEEHSGRLIFEEMHSILQEQCGVEIGRADFQLAFNEMDQELEGSVHHSEFMAAALESKVELTREMLQQAFGDFTMGDEVLITPQSLQQMVGTKYSLGDAEDMIRASWKYCGLDKQEGGEGVTLTSDEFLLLMTSQHPVVVKKEEEEIIEQPQEEKGEAAPAGAATAAETTETTETTAAAREEEGAVVTKTEE